MYKRAISRAYITDYCVRCGEGSKRAAEIEGNSSATEETVKNINKSRDFAVVYKLIRVTVIK